METTTKTAIKKPARKANGAKKAEPLAAALTEADATKPKKRAKKDREGLAVIAGKRSFEPSSLAQKNLLEQSFGAKRFAYNWGLAEQERRREAGLSSSFESLRNALNAVKKEQFP
jgi:hypothetical protein